MLHVGPKWSNRVEDEAVKLQILSPGGSSGAGTRVPGEDIGY